MKDKHPSDVADRMVLRLPDGMRTEIKVRAARARRTMNAEALLMIEAGMGVMYGDPKTETADERQLADR